MTTLMQTSYKKSAVLFLTVFALVFVATHAQAQFNRFAVGVNAGTTGFGGDVTTNIINGLNFRVGYNTLGLSFTEDIEDDPDIRVDGSLAMSSISFLVDYYPFKKGFQITAGLVVNNFDFDADVTPTSTYKMDDKVFQPERLGTLAANLNYGNNLVPYMGIGFGNALREGGRLTFNLQLGAMYSGAPTLSMSGTGMIAPTANHAQSFNEGLSVFEWFPVLNLGLAYRF
jgi:hypothetical protein